MLFQHLHRNITDVQRHRLDFSLLTAHDLISQMQQALQELQGPNLFT